MKVFNKNDVIEGKVVFNSVKGGEIEKVREFVRENLKKRGDVCLLWDIVEEVSKRKLFGEKIEKRNICVRLRDGLNRGEFKRVKIEGRVFIEKR